VPRDSASGPLNAVIDFFHTGRHGFFPRSKMRWPLDGSAFRVNDPAPKARLNLLHVVVDRSVFHHFPFAFGRSTRAPRNSSGPLSSRCLRLACSSAVAVELPMRSICSAASFLALATVA
jgi:hypothetical protein